MMVADTASCTSKGNDWPCKKANCDTKFAPGDDPEVKQYRVFGFGVSCQGGPVEFEVWFKTWWGCDDYCFLGSTHSIACETSPGNCLLGQMEYLGKSEAYKKICGCD